MKTPHKSLAFIFLLIIFISGAYAEDNEGQNNKKITVYLHPSASYFMWAGHRIVSDIIDADPIEFYVGYLTVEIPLSLRYSLIIQPSLWYHKNSSDNTYIVYGEDTNEKIVDKLFRLGSGIGVRHFVNGKGDGLYFQAMSSVHHYSIKEENSLNSKGFYYKKGYYADLLGYLGYSFSSWVFPSLKIFSDIGIGTIFPTNNPSVVVGAYKKPFTFDMNLGMGFSF